jgi:hypothetical protein
MNGLLPEVSTASVGKVTRVVSVNKSKQLGLDTDESSARIDMGCPAVGGRVRSQARSSATLPAADSQGCSGAGTGLVGNWDSDGTTSSGWPDEGSEGLIMRACLGVRCADPDSEFVTLG